MPTQVTFNTLDDVKIVADWYPATTTGGVVILLHMMTNTRHSWAPFAYVLNQQHVAALAIDLRGHGESVFMTSGQKIDYHDFSDEQHLQSLNDISAALDWLNEKGYQNVEVILVGASIGSILALSSIEEHPDLKGLVLLSPGNYRGVNAKQQACYIHPEHVLWAAGSDIDDPEAYESARDIVLKASSERKKFVPYESSGHGVHLFTSDPYLMEDLASWIAESFKIII